MQRIERYGVIALVLLLVTIAAVSFWDDGTSTDAAERGANQREERLAQNSARKAAATRQPQVTHKALPKTAPTKSGTRQASMGYSANRRPAQPKSQPKARPKTQRQGENFKSLSANIVESPGANERVDNRDTSDVEFPDLEPDLHRSRGGSQLAQGGSRGRGPSANDLANGRDAVRTGGRGGSAPPEPKVIRNSPGSSPTASSYTVKSGDSLSAIASRKLGSKDRMGELMVLNGITNPDVIYEGQVLKLPTGAAPAGSLRSVTTLESKAIPSAAPGKGGYVVKSGEVLGVIAQRELGSASRYPEIVALNPGMDADRILEGMRLRMPADWNTSRVVASAETPRASRGTRRASTKSNKVR